MDFALLAATAALQPHARLRLDETASVFSGFALSGNIVKHRSRFCASRTHKFRSMDQARALGAEDTPVPLENGDSKLGSMELFLDSAATQRAHARLVRKAELALAQVSFEHGAGWPRGCDTSQSHDC